jgi:hypothetical protein
MLPYIESLDNISWYESQALIWHVNGGCISGYVVVLPDYIPVNNQHTQYPKGKDIPDGRDVPQELAALNAVYHPLGLIPWPIKNISTEPKNCAPSKFSQMVTELTSTSGDWMVSNAFLTCKEALKSRFEHFVGVSA